MEKALDQLTVDEGDLRRFSDSFATSFRGSEGIQRQKTIRDALKRRKSDYVARKATMKSLRKHPPSTIMEEEQDQIPSHIPVVRTNTYTDPDDLEERDA